MAEGIEADLPTLDSMASRLIESADALDEVGRTSPGVPKAGDVSGIMGAAIAYLTGGAGNIVLGMKGASVEVAGARKAYAAEDQSVANSLQGY
jgi:hypothetical protein